MRCRHTLYEWSLLLQLGSCSSWLKDALTLSWWYSWGFSWREDHDDLVRSRYNKSEMTSKEGRRRGCYEHTLDNLAIMISTSKMKMIMMMSWFIDRRQPKAEVRWRTCRMKQYMFCTWGSCVVVFTWQHFDEVKLKESGKLREGEGLYVSPSNVRVANGGF